MKITKSTKVILFNMETATYRIGTLTDRTPGEMPVCTLAHFFNAVCKLFEDVTPRIKDNPMYQDIDWCEIENGNEMEVPA